MLSILTNFGCHWGCRYCVYRENGINIPHTNSKTFGWNELEEEIKTYKGELISVSGGGDPLFNYQENECNQQWFNNLFKLLEKYNCTLELHTSFLIEEFPYDKCERVVFHLTMPTQLFQIKRNIYNLPNFIRAVYVVQDYYNIALINYISKICCDKENAINELSFRQMIDNNGETKYYCHDFLKKGHLKSWYYIEQNDYNEYFVQNHIEKEYLEIK